MSAETVPPLPPFATLVKSPDVEDPVNRWLHRPLAYAFVSAIYKTSLTPNGVTLIAMLTGMVAGALWIWGTAEGLVAGGILLWTSAILDGADGILARAKKLESQFGRALDGSADMVVAICTVLPAGWRVMQEGSIHGAWILATIVLTVVNLYMYDFYKESFLRMTRLERGGEGEDAPDIEKRLVKLEEEGGHLVTRLAVKQVLLPTLRAQRAIVAFTNPGAIRDDRRFIVNEQTAQIYRKHNSGPMKLWIAISLAPHSYTFAICGMFDQFGAYIWVRLVGMNAIMVAAFIWQRVATQRTMAELAEVGASPILRAEPAA